MKKIFLDCGSNFGQGYEQIKVMFNLTEDYNVHMFEPNPNCIKVLKSKYPSHTIHESAVWYKDGKRIFNIEYCNVENDLVGGSSNILEENFNRPSTLDDTRITWPPSNSKEVETINLSGFIERNFSPKDFFILKLDIEGAEFEVLDSLITTGIIRWINVVIIEWHPHMRKSCPHNQQFYLDIFKQYNINYYEWH